jgi:thymidylate kinase
VTLLILDGMDRTGKTTIARTLVSRHKKLSPLHYLSNVAPPASLNGVQARQYHMDAYLDQLVMLGDRDAIIDRMFMSEQVYGHLYRHQPQKLDASYMALVAETLREVPHLHVTLTASPEEIVARTDGDSTFDVAPTVSRIKLAEAERELFRMAHAGLGVHGIRRAIYDGRHPEDVTREVAAIVGW